MNIYQALNKIIVYIENHLNSDIDYNHIAQLMGTNKDTAKRLFSVLTNTSINEYIKKRRLSKAAYEITHSDLKIIDIALEYGYKNQSSFSKAFKEFHSHLPSEIKKGAEFKNYPPFKFLENSIDNNLYYQIKTLNELKLYGIFIPIDTNNINNSIKNFWKEFNTKHVEKLKYGILVYDHQDITKAQYWICLPYKFTNSQELIIKKTKYMSVTSSNRKAEAISQTISEMYERNTFSNDYQVTYSPDIEIYTDNNVEILLAIE